MDKLLGLEAKSGLLHLDTLDGSERKRFLRSVASTATRDFAFIDLPECPTAEYAQLQNALLTLYTIATKHGVTKETLQRFLTEDVKLQESSIEDILENYEYSKDEIRSKLAKYGHDIPWVTNVNWQLASVIRSSGQADTNALLLYKITFEGTSPTGGRKILTNFDCTLEELQNLSSKFNEIERNCLRIAEGK